MKLKLKKGLKLTWDDLDFERGMVSLREPKGGKTLTTNVSSEALDILRGMKVSSHMYSRGKKADKEPTSKASGKKSAKQCAYLPISNFMAFGIILAAHWRALGLTSRLSENFWGIKITGLPCVMRIWPHG